MSCVSVCASQIAAANIHPALRISKPHTSSHLTQDTLQGLTVWSQISSNFLTRCFTTCRRWGFTAPLSSLQPPWEPSRMNPRLRRSSTILLIDLPCHRLLQSGASALSLRSRILAINHCELPWNACRAAKMIARPSKVQNLISAQHISALSEMERKDKSSILK